MKQYDIIIISYESFPQGKAASNRILSYSVPLAHKGNSVLLLTFSGPSYGNKLNSEKVGTIDDVVDYVWTDNPYYSKRSFLPIRSFLALKRRFVLILDLLFKYKAKTYLQVNRSSSLSLILRLLSKARGSGFYREISETFENDKLVLRKWARHFVCRFTDGVIVISPGIREYFKEIKDDSHFFFLPVLVDLRKFETKRTETENPYFFYCSGGVLKRDGFIDSLKAFLLFHKKYENYKLKCAFPFEKSDSVHVEALSIIREHEDCMEWLGSIPTNDIPWYLANADALLVTPSEDYLTKGFPTKLGEYFASSTPVICTSIDSLKNSLKPGCAFMAEPGNIMSISEKMETIASDREYAREVGVKGKSFVTENYTIGNYLDSLMDFLMG